MERLLKIIGIGITTIIVTSAGIYFVKTQIVKNKFEEHVKKWNSIGEDVVILHQFKRPLTSLNLSPYPVKLEAFLRMAKIKYICDYTYPKHPKTFKSPWITINGQDIADSQLAMEFLAKQFNIDLR